MNPANHFFIPKAWGGLGEIDEVIEAIREYDQEEAKGAAT
jgi:hypothetical protein